MEVAQSPKPQNKEEQIATMKFPEAIKMVILGKKIQRLEWEDKKFYCFLNKDLLSLHRPDGKNYQWIINEGDLMGDDWIVIK